MPLTLVTEMVSVTGPHRSDNQDSVGCAEDYVFVADGVGGHVGGDVASWTITHVLISSLATRSTRDLDADHLRELIAGANADLALRGRKDPRLTGMATTFTGLFCSERAVTLAHIGDSRAYLLRDGVGRRMTRDDSLVQMLVDSGAIDQETADHHPQRNIILRSLAGSLDDSEGLTLLTLPSGPGDRWLVASDGLTDYVGEEAIVACLRDHPSPRDAAEALVRAATEADSQDNITVAVSDVVDGPVPDGRHHRYLGAAASEALGYVGDLSRPAKGS